MAFCQEEAAMPNDNIRVEVLDSRNEFRPGRSGGSVNWMQLLSGVLMLIFGLVCVFCPIEVLMGISAIIAVCVIVAGAINIASYMRYRNTLFAQSGWNLLFGVMIVLLGVVLLLFPSVGATTIAWVFGFGIVIFGIVQLIAARPFFLIGAGLGSMVGISGVAEIVLGVLVCVFPASIGLFLGLFAIVHAIDTIVFSLPIGRDRTNTLW